MTDLEVLPAHAQQGVSPKALIPTVIGLVVGIVLLVVALVSNDSTLRTIAVSELLSVTGFGGVSYVAKPGFVKILRKHIHSQSGYSAIELLAGLVVALVCLVVIVRLLALL